MKRVLVSVEGQTEDALVTRVLQPHLLPLGVYPQPVQVATKRTAGAPLHKGGLTSWAQVEREVRRLLGDSDAVCITTMYDLYAFPGDAPGMADRYEYCPGEERVAHVEAAIAEAFGNRRFDPYLCLHETEALVLAAPEVLEEKAAASPKADVRALCEMAEPELVNEHDPPSKRLLANWEGYVKSIDGPDIVANAGVETVRSACPHFGAWLSRLEALGA